jgi:hypothetical protein
MPKVERISSAQKTCRSAMAAAAAMFQGSRSVPMTDGSPAGSGSISPLPPSPPPSAVSTLELVGPTVSVSESPPVRAASSPTARSTAASPRPPRRSAIQIPARDRPAGVAAKEAGIVCAAGCCDHGYHCPSVAFHQPCAVTPGYGPVPG